MIETERCSLSHRGQGVNKLPVIVKSEGDVVLSAKSMANDARIAPIFLLSRCAALSTLSIVMKY